MKVSRAALLVGAHTRGIVVFVDYKKKPSIAIARSINYVIILICRYVTIYSQEMHCLCIFYITY